MTRTRVQRRDDEAQQRLRSLTNVVLSLVALVLSFGLAVLGGGRQDVYADPGRPETAASVTQARSS